VHGAGALKAGFLRRIVIRVEGAAGCAPTLPEDAAIRLLAKREFERVRQELAAAIGLGGVGPDAVESLKRQLGGNLGVIGEQRLVGGFGDGQLVLEALVVAESQGIALLHPADLDVALAQALAPEVEGRRRANAPHDPVDHPVAGPPQGRTGILEEGDVRARVAPLVGVKLSLLTVVQLVPLAAILAFGLASFGVAIASMMKSLQGFQVVMNFLMMPMFFLSGALFPLTNLPGWMTWLTRLDPASYGIDPIRRVVLSNSGLPNVNSLGLTINGQVLAIPMEAAIMFAFGAVLLGVAVVMFERRD